ncbi:MAG TPA: hypothetical protein VJN43_12205 [Bryobacteraceae bacterium]|nr:hypothetical protein [Bryobacteraceae bacterium]
MRAACALLLAVPALVASNSLTVYDADNLADQTDRVTTFGRPFLHGEISNCPVPIIGGSPLDALHYQADVKNRWDDGSVKFAVISVAATIPRAASLRIEGFRSGDCNNAGYLTQTQMLQFSGGHWGAEIDAVAGGLSKSANARYMLAVRDPADDTFPDCRNDYWLRGPLVTAVIVQDCTSDFPYDFGWQWDGQTMTADSGTLYRSLHPAFVLYFYPGMQAVRVDYVLENDWTGKWQDQLFDLILRIGDPLEIVYGVPARARRLTGVDTTARNPNIISRSAGFSAADVGLPVQIGRLINTTICAVHNSVTATLCEAPSHNSSDQTAYIGLMNAGQRYRKTFWSGRTPGHVLIDHNFPYLVSTKALPNYDQSRVVASTVNPEPDYTKFAEGDKGDRGGRGIDVWQGSQAYSANDEGAPVQREDLLYLYSMGNDCHKANGKCAMAWYMLTGTRGHRDSRLHPEVSGGAGVWNNQGNLPIHLRESRTAPGSFYCPQQAGKDANSRTPCGAGVGIATGKPVSKYYAPDNQFSGGCLFGGCAPKDTVHTNGDWSVDCPHWLDYSYVAYLLTGDFYYLEEEYFGAAYCQTAVNPGLDIAYGNGRYFTYFNPLAPRSMAWPLQTTAHAAFIAPDNTPEQSYYSSIVNSNLEIQEGVRGITGTALTPASPNAACLHYDYRTATRWDWGRCTVASECYNAGADCQIVVAPAAVLHMPGPGACPVYPAIDSVIGVSSAPSAEVSLLLGRVNTSDVYTIFGGSGPWAAINGNYKFIPVRDKTYRLDPAVDTSALPQSPSGSLGVVVGEAGQVSAATNAHSALLTTNTNHMNGYPVEIWGASPPWQKINGEFQISQQGDNRHFAIPVNTVGIPQPLIGPAYWNHQTTDFTKTSDAGQAWQNWQLIVALGHIQELGIAASNAVMTDAYKMLVDMVNNGNIDSNGNPYLVSTYTMAMKDSAGGQLCLLNRDVATRNPFFASWAQWKKTFTPTVQDLKTFDHFSNRAGNYPCSNHGYSLLARAAGVYVNGVTTQDGCAGGTCRGDTAQQWLIEHVPYFNARVRGSSSCGDQDSQLKFAIAPRSK